MHQRRRRLCRQSRPLATALIAIVAALPLLLSVTLRGADRAAAAPAAGYTASYMSIAQYVPAGFGQLGLVAVNPATDTVYTAAPFATGGSELIATDAASGAVVATIPLPGLAGAVAVDSVTDTVYVDLPEEDGNELAVIDGATNEVTGTVPFPAGAGFAIAVDNATDQIYVGGGAGVFDVDGSTDAVVADFSLPAAAVAIAVDESANTLWAVSHSATSDYAGAATELNGTTGAIISTLSITSGQPHGVAVNPVTDTVYVAALGDPPPAPAAGGVVVIDGATGTITTTVQQYGLFAVAADPSADVVYAAGLDNSTGQTSVGQLTIIDGATNTIADTLPAGGQRIALDTATGQAFETTPEFDYPGVWAITPSATNGVSPVIVGSTSLADPGDQFMEFQFQTASATPAATFTETGTLPAGVTLSPSGLLSVSTTPGTGGTYPITVTASNGVAPDYSETFTLIINDAPVITSSAAELTFHAGAAASFTVTATGLPAPTFSETGALPAGVSFSPAGVLSGTPAGDTAGSYPMEVTATNSAGTATQELTLAVDGDSSFVPVSPVRVLDTRTGTGGYDAPVGPGGTISLQVTGVDGVPASAVSAVVLNVTATDPTASSYVTVYPDGQARPTASSLNFTAGETIPNLVTVPVGSDGAVDFYNNSGSTDLVADLEGYYTTIGTDSLYVAAGPSRVLDTRNGTGAPQAPVGPGGTISLQITGMGTVPASEVSAVVLNVTATDPTASSYVTVYPDGTTRPTASNLNFTPGETVPNLVTVAVGSDGAVDFYNNSGSTDLVADLEGYYTTSGTGSSFVPVSPVRLLDTRDGTGGYTAPVGPGGTIGLPVAGTDGLPASGLTAAVLNVTATEPTASSYVTVYPDGITRPVASNLNFTAGETVPNLVVVPVGADGQIDLYNNTGSVELVADLAGYFINP
jgi:DNA-binding beta-propeller fold protein YncE